MAWTGGERSSAARTTHWRRGPQEHLARLGDAPTLEAAAIGADIVIEAAIEDLAAKRAIVRALDGAASPDTILATNTSALRVTDVAGAAARPERVLGLHWFNPAPLMALVEVVAPEGADPAVIARATDIVRSWGKTPVRSTDSPGFIVNRVNRPFTIEALRLLEAGAADVATIDGALRRAGFPMGPFELMDLAGLDVNLAAARGVWEGLGRPEHLRPSPIQERLVAAGHLGRKSGEGFYRYDAMTVSGGTRPTRSRPIRSRPGAPWTAWPSSAASPPPSTPRPRVPRPTVSPAATTSTSRSASGPATRYDRRHDPRSAPSPARSLDHRGRAHAHRPLRRRPRQRPARRPRGGRVCAPSSIVPASTPGSSRTSSSAAPTRPARTTATSRAWPCCSPTSRSRSAA